VANTEDYHFFHWGSRGPSVHLNYESPENTDIEWFYNEVTVPEGEDIIGSYFMANGFAEGYFGIRLTRQQKGAFCFLYGALLKLMIRKVFRKIKKLSF
jgi:hypothetical protein